VEENLSGRSGSQQAHHDYGRIHALLRPKDRHAAREPETGVRRCGKMGLQLHHKAPKVGVVVYKRQQRR
jgi:hypothetical protein